MNIENELKELILSRYKSIREFIIEIDMPYTTIDSMFKRGIGNSSVSNVIKICKALGISADALADGEIVPIKRYREKTSIEITEVLEDTKDLLSGGGEITLDGQPIERSSIESILDAMDVGVELAKKKNEVTKTITKTITKT